MLSILSAASAVGFGGTVEAAGNLALQFDGSDDGVVMDIAPELGASAFTVECWLNRLGSGSTASSGTGGVVGIRLICKGRDEADGDTRDCNCFFAIRSSDNVLVADFEDRTSGANQTVVGATPIASNAWYHVAAAYDGSTWRLYVNGRLDAQLVVNATPRYDSIQHFSLATAANSTDATEGRFNGILDEVRVWNYARGLAEIRSTMNAEVASAAGLLYRWGFNEAGGSVAGDSGACEINGTLGGTTWVPGAPFDLDMPPDPPTLVAPPNGGSISGLSVPLTVHASDPDSDPLTVTFYGRKLMSSPRQPFTIIALPDTQFYSKTYPATFTAQTQWIVNHRVDMSIVYVGHEGDIVDSAFQTTQWQDANISLSVFDNVPDLPFGLCIGNHDEYPQDNPNGTAEFNTWFPYTRYASRPWYGGHQGTTNDNHYILFTAGGMDFIAIHIKYDKTGSPATLAWAGNLLQTHFDRRGILVAHSLLENNAAWTTQGAIVYDALKGYPNLFLMLCGHEHGEARRTDVYNGRTVHTLLADYQLRDLGGDGWLRILQFVPDDNQIVVRTYSPTRGQYEQDADSQFNLTYDMNRRAFVELGTLTAAANSDVGFTWTNIEPGGNYEWYAAVSDGHSVVNGPVWSFTSVHPSTPVIALSLAGIDQTAWIHRNPAADAFAVVNAGVGTLAYTITDDADWLSVQPAAGDSSGETDTVEVLYDVASLPLGHHTATITVASPDAWNSPRTIAVSVEVQTVKPDFDLDGDVDQEDFGHLQVCLSGNGISQLESACLNARLDADTDVDSNDLLILIRCLSGASILPNPTCVD